MQYIYTAYMYAYMHTSCSAHKVVPAYPFTNQSHCGLQCAKLYGLNPFCTYAGPNLGTMTEKRSSAMQAEALLALDTELEMPR